jgi:hypothetical protein
MDLLFIPLHGLIASRYRGDDAVLLFTRGWGLRPASDSQLSRFNLAAHPSMTSIGFERTNRTSSFGTENLINDSV